MPVQDLPAGIPLPLITPHSRSDERMYGDMPVALGHARRRRLLIRAPETASLQWRLTVPQATAWDEWYWTTLRGGAYEARLIVRGIGTTQTETVIARMVEPPRFSRQSVFVDVSVSVVINPTEMGEFPYEGGREPQLTEPPESWTWTGPYAGGGGPYTTLDEATSEWVRLNNLSLDEATAAGSLERQIVFVSVVRTSSNGSATVTYDLWANFGTGLAPWFQTTWTGFTNTMP